MSDDLTPRPCSVPGCRKRAVGSLKNGELRCDDHMLRGGGSGKAPSQAAQGARDKATVVSLTSLVEDHWSRRIERESIHPITPDKMRL
jgi:hypothetical protein